MRFSASALVLGAASSAAGFQEQKVLGGDSAKPLIDVDFNADSASWYSQLEKVFGETSDEVKAIWDEVSMLAPDAMTAAKKSLLGVKPKPHTRRPDSKWDHIVKGADVQSIWVQGEDGESHRKVGGKLESYNLRAKKVDPSKLGVDDVKQYSGYLDDEENDKHLFYCKRNDFYPNAYAREYYDKRYLILAGRVLRIS
jgi:cathepsin A (carboxypeptidase C)